MFSESAKIERTHQLDSRILLSMLSTAINIYYQLRPGAVRFEGID